VTQNGSDVSVYNIDCNQPQRQTSFPKKSTLLLCAKFALLVDILHMTEKNNTCTWNQQL